MGDTGISQHSFDTRLLNRHQGQEELIKKRKKGIIYSVNSWNGFFYNHTNENAEDFKIDFCDDLSNQNWKTFIPAKDEVLIGGLFFLNNWVIRSETSNALGKLFVKNKNTKIKIFIKAS